MFTRLTDLPWWSAIGWTMIHFLWIGALIGLVAFAGRLLLRQSRPQIRYLFSAGCLLIMAASPGLILWHLLPDASHPPYRDHSASEFQRPDVSGSTTLKPMVPFAAPLIGEQDKAVSTWHWQAWWDQVAGFAPWIWLIGTPLTLLFVCTGFAGTRQLRQSSRLVTEAWVVALSAKVHRSLNLSWQVVVATGDRVVSPILIGVIKPMILLPPALISACTPEQLEMILLHELAHVRRWDPLASLVQRLIECVLFYHPMVWVLSRWVRAERENCCDDIVVQHTKKPGAYAETLAFVATSQRHLDHGAALAMAQHPLVYRIRRILRQDCHAMRLSPLLLVGITLALLTSFTVAIGVVAAGDTEAIEPGAEPIALETPATRQVVFPKDRSLGLLSIRDAGTEGWTGWEPFGEARGTVSVPAAKELRLDVHADGIDLAPLDGLGQSDLDQLDLRYPTIADQDLQYVGHIRSLKSVSIIGSRDRERGHFTGRGLSHLRDLPQLAELTIMETDIDETGMEQLAGLKTVQRLFLWNDSKMTAAGLAHLKALPSLRHLSFHQTPVRDEGLVQIRDLATLEVLHIEYADVTEEGIRSLAGMTGLRELSIYAKVPGSALTPLSSLPNLEDLNLAEIRMTDADIEMFKAFPALKSLNLRSDELTGEGMRYLRDMATLEEVSGRFRAATDESMQHLAGLNFKALNLDRSAVGDRGLRPVGGMVELEFLSLSDTQVGDKGLKSLSELESLNSLRVANTTVSNEGIIGLGDKPNLSDLWIRGTKVGDKGFRAIGRMHAMRQLVASETEVTDAGLAHLGNLHLLNNLSLNETRITDKGLKHLAGLQGLETLSLRETSVTDAGLLTLAEFPRLQSLWISGTLITNKGIDAFKQHKPDCEIHWRNRKPLDQSLKVKLGGNAPDLTLEDQMQVEEDLSKGWDSLKPKLTVLEFWATWCGPCTDALPHMNKLIEQLASMPVRFISVTDEDRATVQAFLRDHKMKASIGIDTDRSMIRNYGIGSLPTVLVIDADKTVLQIARPHELDIAQLTEWARAVSRNTAAAKNTITGTVRDSRGNPVAGALVLPLPHGGKPVATDLHGQFQLPGPSEEQERRIIGVLARHEARNLSAVADVDGSRRPLEIVLTEALRLTGRVVTEEGEPIADARVSPTLLR